METSEIWAPRASRETLHARASLYASIRGFFAYLKVLEVDTPILSDKATVDPNIESFVTRSGHWLQTSPEFSMKRLLASLETPIYQIAHVFRQEELGRLHNPEFTLLEWYRPGWDYLKLMDEVEALLRACGGRWPRLARQTYREAVKAHSGLDPMSADVDQLRKVCRGLMEVVPDAHDDIGEGRRDFYLDLLMSARVAPALGLDAPVFIHDFPPSQAALAKVRDGDPTVAERFELFWRGIEIANGFSELTDPVEQRRRFEHDQARRRRRGQDVPPYDDRLTAALESGLQPCAGVAIGLDRLLMLMLNLPAVGDTLSFDFQRA